VIDASLADKSAMAAINRALRKFCLLFSILCIM
jgi:hypothetical protein